MMCISSTATAKASMRNRWDSVGSLADPLLTAATTAMLSQRQQTRLPAQCGPHSTTAITIGTSSLGVIDAVAHDSGHCSWNHSSSWTAPQPHVPDASDLTTDGGLVGGMMPFPFRMCRNVYDRVRSARAAWFR